MKNVELAYRVANHPEFLKLGKHSLKNLVKKIKKQKLTKK